MESPVILEKNAKLMRIEFNSVEGEFLIGITPQRIISLWGNNPYESACAGNWSWEHLGIKIDYCQN